MSSVESSGKIASYLLGNTCFLFVFLCRKRGIEVVQVSTDLVLAAPIFICGLALAGAEVRVVIAALLVGGVGEREKVGLGVLGGCGGEL